MSLLPGATTCCDTCDEPVSVAVPGPAGSNGAAGAAGTNGVNAYTTTTAQFVMPAEGATVVVTVGSSAWATVGQIVAVEVGGAFGHFEVTAKTDSTHMTLENLEDTATGVYATNSTPATVFAIGATVSPAGLQGPAGTTPAGALLAANNLSDVANASTSRTNLGVAIGTNVQAYDAFLTSIAALGTAADRIIYTTGVDTAAETVLTAFARTILDDANQGAVRTTLALTPGTDVQAYDATLQSISALGTAADRYAYTTGVDTWAEGTITNFARQILDDADAATVLSTLGITSTGNMDMLYYRQAVGSGTAGAAFTTGGWSTVPLNTEVVDTGNHGSIAANEITLAAGTYRYHYGVVGAACNRFQGRLYNVTDAGVITDSYGSVVYADSGTLASTISVGAGRFTLASGKTIRMEGNCSNTGTYGAASSFGGGEVYSYIELWKE